MEDGDRYAEWRREADTHILSYDPDQATFFLDRGEAQRIIDEASEDPDASPRGLTAAVQSALSGDPEGSSPIPLGADLADSLLVRFGTTTPDDATVPGANQAVNLLLAYREGVL